MFSDQTILFSNIWAFLLLPSQVLSDEQIMQWNAIWLSLLSAFFPIVFGLQFLLFSIQKTSQTDSFPLLCLHAFLRYLLPVVQQKVMT